MAKPSKTEIENESTEVAYERLVNDRSGLAASLEAARIELAAVSVTKTGGVQRMQELRSHVDLTERTLRDIDTALVNVQRAMIEERKTLADAEVLALRPAERAGYEKAVKAAQAFETELAALTEIHKKLGSLAAFPRFAPPYELLMAMRISMDAFRRVAPELFGLPPIPTREEQLKADAYAQAEHAIRCYKNLEALSVNGGTAAGRSRAKERMEECGIAAMQAKERCRELGVDPPSAGPGIGSRVSMLWDRMTAKPDELPEGHEPLSEQLQRMDVGDSNR